MSYNDSEDEESKYRAEIEFIKAEDWEKELHVLFHEIIDSSGNISKEVYEQDSEAAVAYAKIRAVYNRFTKDQLLDSSVDQLMSQRHVLNLLGTVKKLKCSDPNDGEGPERQWRCQQLCGA